MRKSFYHFLMRYRGGRPGDDISEFAEAAFLDHGFPKATEDYHEICHYLELNGDYLSSMTTFDKVYEEYLIWEK
ncbi:hypothetical protein Q75_08070 [Bacillus coahuilensis p1.1.43]|uniref:UPF0346 protein Q75_08070 n=1 Tax=Bacillus coahuilensis p1.1.43 TaxID=1150625 RepID=A0A147K8D8_9BACI|nr:YozE family protein [Bacillus coahuilensis]KUP06476.1 hypothetical protein Q75_08070 [Bacillus coahuilensis p1.1.43]